MMTIKTWFLEKNFSQDERYLIVTGDLTVIKETEKAYQFRCESDYGTKTFWCPKSCTISESERRFATEEEMKEFKEKGKEVISNDGKKFLFLSK